MGGDLFDLRAFRVLLLLDSFDRTHRRFQFRLELLNLRELRLELSVKLFLRVVPNSGVLLVLRPLLDIIGVETHSKVIASSLKYYQDGIITPHCSP